MHVPTRIAQTASKSVQKNAHVAKKRSIVQSIAKKLTGKLINIVVVSRDYMKNLCKYLLLVTVTSSFVNNTLPMGYVKRLQNKLFGTQNTLLLEVANVGNEDTVKTLLKVPGINVNIQNEHGNTPLMGASWQGHENIVKLILQDPSTNVNVQNENQETALIIAANHSHPNIVKLLLQAPSINVNVRNQFGSTALIIAAHSGYLDVVKILVQAPGIDINAQANNGQTALICAAGLGHIEIVKFLLQVDGIKLVTFDKLFKTAKDTTYPDVAQLIKNAIDKLSAQAYKAIRLNDLKTFKSVIEQIGDYQVLVYEDGKTLLDHAFTAHNPEFIHYLLTRAKDPQAEISRFPFVFTNPTSPVFKYFFDLAYGLQNISANPTQNKESQAICQACSKAATERCSSCKKIYYCSADCQKADWKNHKLVCKR